MFLRTLEYYEGVLILTSNRIGTFDEAFRSRIQLSFHYHRLDGPSSHKIWNNSFSMMRESNNSRDDDSHKEAVDFDDIMAHMGELAGYEMNSRQIRNTLAKLPDKIRSSFAHEHEINPISTQNLNYS